MATITVEEVFDFLQQKAPFETAEGWDNAGLRTGSGKMPAQRVLITLDITPEAVEAAAAAGVQLIVSHHPVIFTPLRRLEQDSAPWLLARYGIAAICAHTNLDMAPGGVNDTLAALLGLVDVHATPDGLGRFGRLPQPLTPDDFAQLVAQKLGTAVRMCQGNRPVEKICLCGGAGGELLLPLIAQVDALLTGELRHHEWLAGTSAGITCIEAGHYATEAPVVDTLAAWLTARFPDMDCQIYKSGEPYHTLA